MWTHNVGWQFVVWTYIADSYWNGSMWDVYLALYVNAVQFDYGTKYTPK